MTVHFVRPPKGWMPPKGKTLETTELDFLPAFAAADYLFLAAKTLENNRKSGPPYRELERRASIWLDEQKGFVTWSIEYPIFGVEKWIDANAEGPGRRHQYFPIERVLPDEVAKHLYPRMQIHKALRRLEDMRRREDGPPWLRLARRVTYYIPDVLEWAMNHGIHSDYVMRPVIADVIVKEPEPDFLELSFEERVTRALALGHPRELIVAAERAIEHVRALGGHKR